jgi:hypothetical protein
MPKKKKKIIMDKSAMRKKNSEFIESLKKNLITGVHQYRDILHFPLKPSSANIKKIGFAYMVKTPEKLYNPSKLEPIKYDILKNKKYDMFLTKTIKLYPTDSQKEFLNIILNASTEMYNFGISYINELRKNKQDIPSIDVFKKDLYKQKLEISNKYILYVNGKQKNVSSHMLDYALQDARNKFASCNTMMEENKIKHFRLRKKKFNKCNKIFKLEESALQEHSFLSSVLGDKMECSIKNYNFKENFESVAIVTKRGNNYYFLVKYTPEDIDIPLEEHIASIDPGIRTTLTIYSDNGIVEIGINMKRYLGEKIKMANNVMNDDVKERLKKRYLKKLKRANRTEKFIEKRKENIEEIIQKKQQKIKNKKINRIKRQVNDFQWKVADYLTKEYKSVLFGNMSTKKTGEQDDTDPMTKEVGKMIGFYGMKEKIKNKCLHRKRKYKEVNEAYTTCMCGACGNIKTNLGSNEKYYCDVCGIMEERDKHSSRLMLITGMKQK